MTQTETLKSSEAPATAIIQVEVVRVDDLNFFRDKITGSRKNGIPYFHRVKQGGTMLYDVTSENTIAKLFVRAVKEGQIYVPKHIFNSRQS